MQLNAAQQTAFDAIGEAIQAHAFRTFLLHGVTGSGKTEVYLKAIDAALACGSERAAAGAGDRADARGGGAVLSAASASAWRFCTARSAMPSARSSGGGSARARRSVVVGTRSGVFAPVRNLGLIIVDEEHDGSYKQEENAAL